VKILQVIPCYLPAHRYGGPVKSVHELSRKLVELGAEVTVFTTNADGPDDLDVPIGSVVLLDGVKVHYFSVEKPRSYFRSPGLNRALAEQIHQFDLVHINWLYVYPTLTAARQCLRQNVPYILSSRGMLDSNAVAMKGELKKKLYLSLIEKKHLAGAAALHFTSYGEEANSWQSGWNKRHVVVYNGINLSEYADLPDIAEFDQQFPELYGKKIVLFLGRLNYIKGLDLLTQAWPMVVRDLPDAHLVIAGPDDDGYGVKVRQWIRDGGCEQNVTFTGMLLGREKLAALSRADMFVASSYLESFGMAIVEAMACGKPVVITDRVNICREVEQAGAGIVTPCDPPRIADALIMLLKNPKVGREMGTKGLKFVANNFTWDKAAREMTDVYEDVLLKRKR